MAARELPSQEVLRQLLDYNPNTGELTWKVRGVEWFPSEKKGYPIRLMNNWNRRYAGTPALNHVSAQGYREGNLLQSGTKAHRVIWKLIHNVEADQIDHINGIRTDNRMINLRDVGQSENQKNARIRKDNTSGHVGVSLYPHERKTPKWLVKIKGKHVGLFDTKEEAIAARKAVEVEYGFHENHGRAA